MKRTYGQRLLTATTAVLIATTMTLAAQDVPGTDLFLYSLGEAWEMQGPTPVTDRDGYDNQPYFTPDGEALLFTSMRDGQTDIYRYDLAAGETVRLTATEDSEYSPTPLPDGSGFSCIRQTTEGRQLLWSYDHDGSPRRLLLKEVEPVGYHAWLDNGTLALFILGEPMTLQIADLSSGEATVRDGEIGRALHRAPGDTAITYVRKGEAPWTIRRMPAAGGDSELIAPTLDGSEDFIWTPGGELLMGSGSKLFVTASGADEWTEVADLSADGVTRITRLAISPNGEHLVVVGERQ